MIKKSQQTNQTKKKKNNKKPRELLCNKSAGDNSYGKIRLLYNCTSSPLSPFSLLKKHSQEFLKFFFLAVVAKQLGISQDPGIFVQHSIWAWLFDQTCLVAGHKRVLYLLNGRLILRSDTINSARKIFFIISLKEFSLTRIESYV